MPIKVSVKSIDNSTFQKVLDYYNEHKPAYEQPLESLRRAEGGFQIKIQGRQDDRFDSNDKIQQLRWSRGELVSGAYIGFSQEQETLLFNALVHGLGKECVSM